MLKATVGVADISLYADSRAMLPDTWHNNIPAEGKEAALLFRGVRTTFAAT